MYCIFNYIPQRNISGVTYKLVGILYLLTYASCIIIIIIIIIINIILLPQKIIFLGYKRSFAAILWL